MNVAKGQFTISANGTLQVADICNFPIKEIELHCTVASSENGIIREGHGNGYDTGSGIFQRAYAWVDDSGDQFNRRYTDKVIKFVDVVSGSLTGVIEASLVSFDDTGGGLYGFTLNVTQNNSSYPIDFTVRG